MTMIVDNLGITRCKECRCAAGSRDIVHLISDMCLDEDDHSFCDICDCKCH